MSSEQKPDETIPGGYYIGADGKPHDANGRPLEASLTSGDLDEATDRALRDGLAREAARVEALGQVKGRPINRQLIRQIKFAHAKHMRPGNYVQG